MNENEIIKAYPEVEIIPPDGIDKSRRNKDIPIETIIEYRSKGLSLNEIAKLIGCSKQNVHKRLEAVGYSKEDLENFKNHRADVFAFLQSRLLNSIDDETIKELNAYQRIIGIGVLYDKERLTRGQSTANVDVHELFESIEQRQARIDALREELGCITKTEEIKTDENKQEKT